MKEEKTRNSKIYSFFDWVWRLMALNVITIVTSLGIITIMPSICACFKTIKDTKEEKETKIFKPYFENFRYLFRDTVWFSVIFVAVVGICGYAYLWYDGVLGETGNSIEHLDKVWQAIAMFGIVILIGCFVVVFMAFIQLPMVINYFSYGYKDNIKLSFLIAFKYLMTSIIELAVAIASIALLINAIVINSLIPAWLFFGITIPELCIYLISRRVYRFLALNEEDDGEDIDYQNKTVNRETYEDDTKTNKGEQND